MTPIAIVGMAARTPGAADINELWQLLSQGGSGLIRLDEADLIAAGVRPETIADPAYVPVRGTIDEIEMFDAHLFGYSPLEAATLDPQQRVFMELAHAALEDAAVDPARFEGRIGTYAGSLLSTYLLRILARDPDLIARVGQDALFQANQPDQLATRVAYALNLKGPAMAIQSACSTSLVAVHQACQSLATYEIDLALAGGLAIRVPQAEGYRHAPGGIVSATGQVRTFDADADGTVFSNGGGVVVLRRLEDALAARAHIYGVLIGTAANNDGSEKAGYNTPSLSGQIRLIGEALGVAGVEAGSIDYVEAHGTATRLGDSIEWEALARTYGAQGERPCAVRSTKANLGHLDTGAGVVGLIAATLSLQKGAVLPAANFNRFSPELTAEAGRLTIPRELMPWPAMQGRRRRAAVSAFGVGGTNAHVLIEEAPHVERVAAKPEPRLFVLSARTTQALDQAAGRLGRALIGTKDPHADSVARTLAQGRRLFEHRRAIVARSIDELTASLATRESAHTVQGLAAKRVETLLLFPGQGAQTAAMGAKLYRDNAAARMQIDDLLARIGGDLAEELRQIVFSEIPPTDAGDRLRRTDRAQPALFIMSLVVARQLEALGVGAHAMLGHSLGEYATAYKAGVFDLDDALELVCRRGEAMARTEPGAMLGLAAGVEIVRGWCREGIELAADNGPQSCVVSGDVAAITALAVRLKAEGVASRRLDTDRAFHSKLMQPAADALLKVLSKIKLHAPQRALHFEPVGPMAQAGRRGRSPLLGAPDVEPRAFSARIGDRRDGECRLRGSWPRLRSE